jgi:hypothetical protein
LGEGFNTQVITLWCFYIVLHMNAETSVYARGCVYGIKAPAVYTHLTARENAPTLRSIRTLGCVNAPTRVYAPTAASLRI